jgi:hypothetical protein
MHQAEKMMKNNLLPVPSAPELGGTFAPRPNAGCHTCACSFVAEIPSHL